MDRLRSKPIGVRHVGDTPDFCEVTEIFFEREMDHCTVETATTTSEGLDHLREHDFDRGSYRTQ